MGKKLLIIAFLVMALAGCNQLENLTQSGSKLLLMSLTGKDLEGNDGSTILYSDVETNGDVFNDVAVASLSAVLLNPLAENSTYYQSIMVDTIAIRYTKTNSNNVQGVDVPYAFTQNVSVVINIGETIEVPFTIMRHNAKLEPPLIQLRSLSQDKVLQLYAHVTINGSDLAGNRVEPVTGIVTVWCANFADSQG